MEGYAIGFKADEEDWAKKNLILNAALNGDDWFLSLSLRFKPHVGCWLNPAKQHPLNRYSHIG